MFRTLVAKRHFPVALEPHRANKNAPVSSFLLNCLFRRTFCVEAAFQEKAKESPAVSYLVDSCELSPKSARSAADFVGLKSATNTDSIPRLFKGYGFSDAHITKVIAKFPQLLKYSEKNVKPKLDFLVSAGFKSDELVTILVANPFLLSRSLQNFIVPTVLFLKSNISYIPTILGVLKRIRCLPIKLEFLRGEGIPDSIIARILTFQPRAFNHSVDRLRGAVNSVKEMGIDPKSKTFGTAVGVLASLHKSTWLRKKEFYHGLGWSNQEILSSFCKQPAFVNLSNETVLKKLEFFRESVGWDHTVVVKNPAVLGYSLEKRIVPRVSVLNILAPRGLIPKHWGPSKLKMGNECFFNDYVKIYQDAIPELLDVYQPALQEKK